MYIYICICTYNTMPPIYSGLPGSRTPFLLL